MKQVEDALRSEDAMDAPLQDRRAARNTRPRDVAADDASAHRSTTAQEPSIEVWDGKAIERTHVR